VFASLNNAALKAKFEEWKAALEQIPQAKSLEDPKFTYGYYLQEVETRVGPQRQKFGIMQVFPWLGKIEARTDVAAAKAKAARQGFEAAKLKLYWQVKKEFYEFSYLKEAIDIAQQNLELINHFEQVALTKYTTSAGTHPDIIRAQIESAKYDEIVVSLKELKKPQIAALNAIFNRPADTELNWPQKPEFVNIAVDIQQLINLLREKNPQLAQLGWEIEAARSNVELAKKKFYPDIGVGVDWIQTGHAQMSGVRDSGKDAVVLMFSMNIPLWRDSYKAAEEQAKANVRKAAQQKINAENTLMAQTVQVLYDIQESQRKIDLNGNILIPKAEQLVNASEAAYKAGTVDFLSLIDSQRMLLKYTLDYQRLLTDNQQKLAELEMLTATDLSEK
ncbi:MAG: TolC family protein, partial [Phycisphaerae bacterium]|nr:TolC family protein [Phycisphaerae bacterium]